MEQKTGQPKHPMPSSPAPSSPAPSSPVKRPGLVLPPSSPPPRSLPGCNRWTAIGCLGAVILIVIALLSGLVSIDSSLLALVNRASDRIRSSLPDDLSSELRSRTLRNLDQLPAAIENAPDPNFVIGRFLGLAGAALDDRQLSNQELEELNLFMEALTTGVALPERG